MGVAAAAPRLLQPEFKRKGGVYMYFRTSGDGPGCLSVRRGIRVLRTVLGVLLLSLPVSRKGMQAAFLGPSRTKVVAS
jgi:hypothetical protein